MMKLGATGRFPYGKVDTDVVKDTWEYPYKIYQPVHDHIVERRTETPRMTSDRLYYLLQCERMNHAVTTVPAPLFHA